MQLPGRGKRVLETPIQELDELVSRCAEALEPHLDRPFALFGHSLGALVAYEVAHLLTSAGERVPGLLFVSSHRAPDLPMRRERIHSLPDAGFRDALRDLGSIPSSVLDHEELMSLLIPALRADFRIFETYEYVDRPPLPFPISVLGGMNDDLVTPFELDAWHRHTRTASVLRTFPGGHFYLESVTEDVLGAVVSDLELHLGQVPDQATGTTP